jgi:tRNA pseudouridine55 synthase
MRQTGSAPARKEIDAILPNFRGEINQVPPPYSAIKVRGAKAYELAREGKDPELEPRNVTIYDLEITGYKSPDLSLEIECSAGTYIRSLAHDLGEQLSTGAHLAALRRIKAGPFTIKDAVPLPKLEVGFMVDKWERYLVPAAEALPEFPIVELSQEDLNQVRYGHRISAAPDSSGMARAISPEGELVAILEAVEDGTLWHPRKVFVV